jgi:hypothetical protein
LSDKTPFDTACERILNMAVRDVLSGEGTPRVLHGLRPEAREWMLGAILEMLEEPPDPKRMKALWVVQELLLKR